jgi:hypothetical protein
MEEKPTFRSIKSKQVLTNNCLYMSTVGVIAHLNLCANKYKVQLDLIHTRLDLIHTRLDLIHTRLNLIHTRLDLIHIFSTSTYLHSQLQYLRQNH